MKRVVVMTRSPVLGRVKTRLARHIGPARALAIHRQMAEIAINVALDSGLPVELSVQGDLAHPWVEAQRGRGIPVHAQATGDLGARMRHALDAPGRVVLMGTDCPVARPEWLRAAAEHPEDVVLGPVDDGGYWMIAMDHPHAELFLGMPWSTDQVAPLTRARALAMGLSLHALTSCYDIDDTHDLGRLARDPRCPATLRSLLR